MHRPRLAPSFGLLAVTALVVTLLGGAFVAAPLAAQDDPATPAASPAASPLASPAASPVATNQGPLATFVSGRWRIAVVAARRVEALPDFELAARAGKEWVVVFADVTNWSDEDATLRVRNFDVRVTGGAEPYSLATRTTPRVAEILDLEPKDIREGVRIRVSQTKRVVLVFQIDADGANPSLELDAAALPLTNAFAASDDVLAPRPVKKAPTLSPAEVDDVPDASSLTVAGGTTVRLAGLDAPLPDECFGGQATARLKRLAGTEVLLEAAENGADYVWVEQENGTRLLLNQQMVADGFSALTPAVGPFGDWLAETEHVAKTTAAGLWGGCTSQHGVARAQGPERSAIRVRSDGTDRGYLVWIAWEPEIVTMPDGAAWIFFSAETTDGADQGKKRLYASYFDPATGEWTPAVAMPGGDIQFGPAAVVDERGLVHVVYTDRARDEPGVRGVLVYTRENGSGGWTEPVAVAPDEAAGDQLAPSLAIDRDGVLHVVWQDQRAFSPEARQVPVNADIFASDLGPDGVWTKPFLVNTHLPTAAASRPKLVADGDRLVAVWSIYTSASGLTAAARLEWAMRPISEAEGWTVGKPLLVGRGESFGGRLIAMAADPNGGTVLAFGRQANDVFLFARRLAPGATEWGGDTLITFGARGTYPSIAVNRDGIAFITYNAGGGSVIDVGATSLPFRSIEPGPERLLTQDDPNTQGLAVITTDTAGRPWLIYFSEEPGGKPDKVWVMRYAEIPTVLPPPEAEDEG